MRYFEDFHVGKSETYGAYTLTKEKLIEFASQFDMQPMHLDEVAAKNTFIGELCSSGWQTASLMMKMMFTGFIHNTKSYGAPGIEELKWLKPVKPNDILTLTFTPLEKNLLRSRPEMGRVKFHFEMFNHSNEKVLDVVNWCFIGVMGAPPPKALPLDEGRALVAQRYPDLSPRSMLYEDFEPNKEYVIGVQHFTREAIIAFAKEYDPQPFHLSDEGAAASYFGRLSASGWHTASLWMRSMIGWRNKMGEIQAAAGLSMPIIGPAAGFKNLKWLRPVYAGDTLTFTVELIDKTPSISRAGWAKMTNLNKGFNQYGDQCYEFTGVSFMSMKS